MPDLETLGPLALYVFLTALVFAESGILVGFWLPGDTVLFAAGALSARDDISLTVLLLLVVPAAVIGDSVGYAIGARGGRPLVERRPKAARHLARTEAFFDRYGAWSVVIARWIPWVRTFTPVLAGVAHMPYRLFLVANVSGALCWGAGLLVVGHLVARAA